MPLDLSCRKSEDDTDVNDDKDDDEVVVTLEIPAPPQPNVGSRLVCREPIVILSDSSEDEDSDSDVTILSDVTVLPSGKDLKFGEIPIDSDSDSDADDCFVSSFQASKHCDDVLAPRPITAHAGIKRMDEDSAAGVSSPSSGVASLPADAVCGGKDPFLSDASSGGDDLGVRLVVPLHGRKGVSAFSRVDRSSTSMSLPLQFGMLDGSRRIKSESGGQTNCLKSSVPTGFDATMGAGSLLTDVELSHIKSSLPGDVDADMSTKAPVTDVLHAVLAAAMPSADSIAFRISHLLGTANHSVKPVTAALDDIPTIKPRTGAPLPHGVPAQVSDLSSLFCVPSFDSLYPDRPAVTRHAPGSGSSKAVSPSSSPDAVVDFDVPSPVRISGSGKRKLITQKSGSAARTSCVLRTDKVGGADDKSSGSSSRPANKAWKVVSKGECKVLLRRSTSHVPSSSSKTDVAGCRQDLVATSPIAGAGKKRRLSLGRLTPTSLDMSPMSPDVNMAEPLTPQEMSLCYGCRNEIPVCQLSYCMAGHGCCGLCLQSQVKTLLASGKKVNIV